MRGFSFRESASPEAQFPGTPLLGNLAVVLSCVAYRPRSTYVATQDKASFREARLSETGLPGIKVVSN